MPGRSSAGGAGGVRPGAAPPNSGAPPGATQSVGAAGPGAGVGPNAGGGPAAAAEPGAGGAAVAPAPGVPSAATGIDGARSAQGPTGAGTDPGLGTASSSGSGQSASGGGGSSPSGTSHQSGSPGNGGGSASTSPGGPDVALRADPTTAGEGSAGGQPAGDQNRSNQMPVGTTVAPPVPGPSAAPLTPAMSMVQTVASGTGNANLAASPASQVVQVVTPLQSVDGVHHLVLALSPEGLGTVQASVTVSGNAVAVHLTVDNPAAHQALADSLSQLQHDMGSNGSQVSVSLSQGGDRNGSPDAWQARQRGQGGTGRDDPGSVDTAAISDRAGAASLVDLRL